MKSPLAQLLARWLILALGVLIATRVVPGIHCSDPQALVVAVLLLSFLNAILRPLLLLFTLPFIILTMGLGIVVINAILFLMVGWFVRGFRVEGFLAAVGGSIVLSVTNIVVSRLIRASGPPPPPGSPDVIDI